MSENLKQATLKKFGFLRRVEPLGEDIVVYILIMLIKLGWFALTASKYVRTK